MNSNFERATNEKWWESQTKMNYLLLLNLTREKKEKNLKKIHYWCVAIFTNQPKTKQQ